jgi:hypothetical protein
MSHDDQMWCGKENGFTWSGPSSTAGLTLNFLEPLLLHWSNRTEQRHRRTWHVELSTGTMGVFSDVSLIWWVRRLSSVRRA